MYIRRLLILFLTLILISLPTLADDIKKCNLNFGEAFVNDQNGVITDINYTFEEGLIVTTADLMNYSSVIKAGTNTPVFIEIDRIITNTAISLGITTEKDWPNQIYTVGYRADSWVWGSNFLRDGSMIFWSIQAVAFEDDYLLDRVLDLQIIKDDYLAMAQVDGKLSLLETYSVGGGTSFIYNNTNSNVHDATVSPDGKKVLFVVENSTEIHLYNTDTQQTLVQDMASQINSVQWTDSGRIFAITDDKIIQLNTSLDIVEVFDAPGTIQIDMFGHYIIALTKSGTINVISPAYGCQSQIKPWNQFVDPAFLQENIFISGMRVINNYQIAIWYGTEYVLISQ